MNKIKSSNQSSSQITCKYILAKYKNNIDKISNSIKVYPKSYDKDLSKPWHVYFYYYQNNKRKTFKLSSFKINGQLVQINRLKTAKERKEYCKTLIESIRDVLKTDPTFITKLLYGEATARELYPSIFIINESQEKKITTIEEAFNTALSYRRKYVGESHYKEMLRYKNKLLDFMGTHKLDSITVIDKKILIDFLDATTKSVSNKTFNMYKGYLSVMMDDMVVLDLIDKNPMLVIKGKKTENVIRYVSYTEDERDRVFKYYKENNFVMYALLLHVYYGLMRPKTILKIKLEDIDIKNRTIRTDTKTGLYNKLIPYKLFDEIYTTLNFKKAKKGSYLFARNSFLKDWSVGDVSKRKYYTQLFAANKEELDLKEGQTIYAMRHTGIKIMFKNKFKELKDNGEANYKTKAIEYIRQFTNHKSNAMTEEYLKGVSTYIFEDGSKYL